MGATVPGGAESSWKGSSVATCCSRWAWGALLLCSGSQGSNAGCGTLSCRSDGVFGGPTASMLQDCLFPRCVEPRGLQGGVRGLPDGRRLAAQHPNARRAGGHRAAASGEGVSSSSSSPPSSVTFPACRSCGLERWAGLEQRGGLWTAISGSVWFAWTITRLETPAAPPPPAQSCTAGRMEAPPPLGEPELSTLKQLKSPASFTRRGLKVHATVTGSAAGFVFWRLGLGPSDPAWAGDGGVAVAGTGIPTSRPAEEKPAL